MSFRFALSSILNTTSRYARLRHSWYIGALTRSSMAAFDLTKEQVASRVPRCELADDPRSQFSSKVHAVTARLVKCELVGHMTGYCPGPEPVFG